MTPVARVLEALEAAGCDPKKNGPGWQARCPAHEDHDPSLKVDEGDSGNALLHCHAGCDTASIVSALGLTTAELFPTDSRAAARTWNRHTPATPPKSTYIPPADIENRIDTWGAMLATNPERLAFLKEIRGLSDEVILAARLGWDGERYTIPIFDHEGAVLYVRRYLPKGAPKILSPKGATAALYGIETLAALPDRALVLVVGGELDRLRALTLGYNAVSGTGGEGCWRDPWSGDLVRFEDIVSLDNDRAGAEGSDKVVASLRNAGAKAGAVVWPAGTPPKTDLTDYTVKQGHTAEEFAVLVDEARATAGTAPKEEPPSDGWKRVDILSLLSEDEPDLDWLGKNILGRGECESFTAPPKHCKTDFWLSAVVAATVGKPMLGAFEVPKAGLRVLWIDEEMGRAKLRRRLKRIVAGLELSRGERDALSDRLDLRPQQGFALDPRGTGVDTLRRAIEAHRADLVVFDSFTALQQGDESSNTDRRAFYGRVLAPIKSEFGCGIVLLSHPPLPPSDGKGIAPKRPRGAGDALAFVDRALWLEKSSEERTEFGKTIKLSLEETHSREGGGIEPRLVVLEDTAPDATVCRAEGAMAAEGADKLGKANAAGWRIIRYLCEHGGEAYQPDLIEHCEQAGIKRDAYYAGIAMLEQMRRVRTNPPRPGKSGKWIVSVEDPE